MCPTAVTDQVYYYFNVSYINRTEDVLEAELHLYKLRPSATESRRVRRNRPRSQQQQQHRSHVVDVSIALQVDVYNN